MANKNFTGTGVALVTPFTKSGSIDFSALEKLVNHLIKGGVEYLVPLGTTGESITLSKQEKRAVMDCVITTNKRRIPIIMGLGGSNTAEIIFALDAKELESVDAILSVTPYYNKPSQKGLYEHYKAISQHSPLPIILYNVPARTSLNMTAETTLRLAHDFKNIVAIKEASGNMDQVMNIIQNKPKDFIVISGDDNLTLAMIACGAEGVISVSANSFPKMMSDMVRAAVANKMDKARELHYKLFDVTNLLFAEGSPAGVKELLQHQGICKNYVRMPLANVSKELSSKLKSYSKDM